MQTWQLVLLTSYAGVVCIVAARTVAVTIGMKKVRFLHPGRPKLTGPDYPKVSVVVPAKDEAHGIERCVRSILAQDYPNFELIVVDDRSEDDTAAIVERIAAEDSRLRLLKIESLPPGWTGKTHALEQAQKLADGDWLLFVDADAALEPSCLAVALWDAIDHDVQLETMLPALEAGSFWERVVQPFAGICLTFYYPLPLVNQKKRLDKAFANGQFILIRRDAYEAIGRHESVRDKFVEDIHIGRRTRQHGYGLRCVLGPEVLTVRMYASLDQILRGWSRIFYSGTDHDPWRLMKLVVSITVFSVLGYVALVAGLFGSLLQGGAFWYGLLGLGVLHETLQTLTMWPMYRASGSRPTELVARPLAVVVMLAILVRTIRMCFTHDVTWRGTRYDATLQQAK